MKRVLILNMGYATYAFCLFYACYDITFGSVEPIWAIVVVLFGKYFHSFTMWNAVRVLHNDYDKNMKKYEENKDELNNIRLYKEKSIKKKYTVLGEVKVAEVSEKRAMMAMLINAYELGADAVMSIHDYYRVSPKMLNMKEGLIYTKNVMFIDRNDTYLNQEKPLYFYEGIAIKFEKEKKSRFFSKKKPKIAA